MYHLLKRSVEVIHTNTLNHSNFNTMKYCETCNAKRYIQTAVYHHPTIPDGTERVEVCDECKHNKS
jgi:hypothetical protein